MDESQGMPAVVSIPWKEGIPVGEFQAFADGVREKRKQHIRDILDPRQLDRLKEVVYNIEVAQIGYKRAILDGFLGEDSGIPARDRTALETTFANLEIEMARQGAKFLQQTVNDLVLFVLFAPWRLGVRIRAIGGQPCVVAV